MFFPRKDQNPEKILPESQAILERVLWEEQMLEEKSLKINSNPINPYKDLEFRLENNNKTLKEEYKKQIDSFDANFQKFFFSLS